MLVPHLHGDAFLAKRTNWLSPHNLHGWKPPQDHYCDMNRTVLTPLRPTPLPGGKELVRTIKAQAMSWGRSDHIKGPDPGCEVTFWTPGSSWGPSALSPGLAHAGATGARAGATKCLPFQKDPPDPI